MRSESILVLPGSLPRGKYLLFAACGDTRSQAKQIAEITIRETPYYGFFRAK
jgi:hypothetical protein